MKSEQLFSEKLSIIAVHESHYTYQSSCNYEFLKVLNLYTLNLTAVY